MALESLLKSNIDSTDIIRLREYDFSKDPFTSDKYSYVPGLFNVEDLSVNPDVTQIKERAVSAPEPLKNIENKISARYFCERPAYITASDEAYIYPLDYNLYRCKVDDYIGNQIEDIILYRDLVPGGIEGNDSKKEQMIKEGYNNPYNTSDYNQKLVVCHLGASPFFPEYNNKKDTKNLLKYNTGYSSWLPNWKVSSNITVTALGGNSFIAVDTMDIKDANSSGDSAYFERSIELSNLTEQYYCFSFFARVTDINSGDSQGSTIDTNIIDEREITKSKIKLDITGNNIETICNIYDSSIDYTDDIFTINNRWKRISRVVKAPANATSLTIKITWDSSLRNHSIRLCGLLLENQSYPSAYDGRFFTYKDNQEINNTYKYPLLIYFNDYDIDKKEYLWHTHSWTISYQKIVEAHPYCDQYFVDLLGSLKIGYKGTSFIIMKDNNVLQSIDLTTRAINFYNHSTNNFIIYDKDSQSLTIKVFTMFDNFEISLNNITANLASEYFTTSLLEEYTSKGILYTDLVKYNFILGGYNPDSGTNGYYKNVVYIPELVSNSEISKMNNGFFGVSSSSVTYERNYLLTPTIKGNKTWSQILLLNSASIGDAYILDDDAYILGNKVYSKGDTLICKVSFTGVITESVAQKYWSRYVYQLTSEDKTNISVLRASSIYEGKEKVNED